MVFRRSGAKHLRRAVLLSFVAGLLVPQLLTADQSDKDTRGRLGNQDLSNGISFSPVNLNGGSTLTLISPYEWKPVGTKLTTSLELTHRQFSRLLGPIPTINTSLRLMDEETFFLSTGAPRWTNALYYRGQIIIPIEKKTNIDFDNLSRSIRHEYTHAIINALSGGRCPGWMDEGMAQWAEGEENSALRPALLQYLKAHPPVPLALLQGGFTKLENVMVAAAYAQSLISARTMIETFGFQTIRQYFEFLKQGEDKAEAFLKAFGLSQEKFEQRLDSGLIHWVSDQNSLDVSQVQ